MHMHHSNRDIVGLLAIFSMLSYSSALLINFPKACSLLSICPSRQSRTCNVRKVNLAMTATGSNRETFVYDSAGRQRELPSLCDLDSIVSKLTIFFAFRFNMIPSLLVVIYFAGHRLSSNDPNLQSLRHSR